MLMLSKPIAYRLHWQSLHASIDNECREIERELDRYRVQFEADQRKLAIALVHVPGNALEETIMFDAAVRKELKDVDDRCDYVCEFDVICNGEELPDECVFFGSVGYGEGRIIRVRVPVRFECTFTQVIFGQVVKSFTGWVVK
jgi:hypothetical protein